MIREKDYVGDIHKMAERIVIRKDCKLLGFASYDDGSFHLEIELPYKIKIKESETEFIRLFFGKESKEFIDMMMEAK